jgi:hypothetical protein
MKYFVDSEYGEVYADRTYTGGFAWNEAKGNSGKAGYHSIETGYYAYLYGSLFYTKQSVTLHYHFQTALFDRDIVLAPLAIESSRLKLSQVLHDGQAYTEYDPISRTLTLPAGTGGHFEVTFEPVEIQAGRRGDVNQDQIVNILDALRAVNIILTVGDPPSQYESWAADCNNDGVVNIVDVLGIVNALLGISDCEP